MRAKIRERAAFLDAAAGAALVAREATAQPAEMASYYENLATRICALAREAQDAVEPTAGQVRSSQLDYGWSRLNAGWLFLIDLLPDDQLAGSVPDILATVVSLSPEDPRRVAVEQRWPHRSGAPTISPAALQAVTQHTQKAADAAAEANTSNNGGRIGYRRMASRRLDSAATSAHLAAQAALADTAITTTDRRNLAAALEAGFEVAAESRDALRRFVRLLARTTGVFAIVLGVLTVVALWRPSTVPLCAQTNHINICPTGPHTRPTGGDIPLIELFGLLGAAMAGARALSGLAVNSTSNYSLPAAQALLKLVFGAATAVAGTLFVRAGLISGITPTSSLQLLSYAVIFGYAQQILTGLIDKRANTLLTDASAKTSAGAAPP